MKFFVFYFTIINFRLLLLLYLIVNSGKKTNNTFDFERKINLIKDEYRIRILLAMSKIGNKIVVGRVGRNWFKRVAFVLRRFVKAYGGTTSSFHEANVPRDYSQSVFK